MSEHAYPWEDDFSHVERAFKHTWRGMRRDEWNASPSLRGCQICPSCGYRWDEIDFTYRGLVLRNGEPAPLQVQLVCWNCWMLESQSDAVARMWDAADRPAVGAGSSKVQGLKSLGGRS
jgi:hypothetical protein